MKKLVTLALCLMFGLFALVGCSDESTSPYAGTWTGTTAAYAGIELPVEDILGNSLILELENNGNCTLINGDETTSGKWTETDDGFIVEDTFTIIANLDNNTGSCNYNGVTLNFIFKPAAQ